MRGWRALAFFAAFAILVAIAAAEDSSFGTKVRPTLEARCSPCHFAGGNVYGRLPFDRPDVVRRLGSARLFTRLKDEKDRAVIREFLGEKRPSG
ncbi:MAG TPA: hypothetical protein VFL12_07305 [Thermoanaerobaculia bacterium]|nr:hypothetical protein [Thermoanaerobaculia bacterium]